MNWKVGEVALFRRPEGRATLNGTEVTIVGPLRMTDAYDTLTCKFVSTECYRVDSPLVRDLYPYAKEYYAPPEYLHRREPPTVDRQDLGEWALCLWQPPKVTVL